MVSRFRQVAAINFLALGALCSFAWIVPAYSQSEAAGAAQRAPSAIEEVIVTAQKQAQNVQNVPITVTPITGDALEQMHIQNLGALNGSVANLQVTVNSGVATSAGIVIRGIGEVNNPTPYAGKEVAVVVDGVEQGTNQLGLTDQFDLQRIEVLSGPQGTLFGANTTGGVINVITRQPSGKYDAYGEISLGNYNRRDIWGAVDLPLISDVLVAKISASHVGRDGFYTNLYNGSNIDKLNSNTIRGYLKWTPNANLDVTLESQVQTIDIGDTLLQNLAYPGEVFYRPNTPVNFTIYDNVPGLNKVNTQSHTITANWSSGFGQVTSITNYQDYNTTGNLDVAGINCYCLDQFSRDTGWQASEELRDAFHVTKNLRMLVGVFGQTWYDDTDGPATIPFVSPNLVTRGITKERSSNLSAFAQGYWDITDRLEVQGGVRVSWDKVFLSEAALNYFQPAGTSPLLLGDNLRGAILLPYTPGNQPNSGKHDWLDVGGKIGLNYHVTDQIMTYGYYARGFKSGGFNGRVTVAQAIGPYDAETVDTFEVGVKSEWFNHRLQLNASAFLNKWANMQVQQSNYTGPTIASVILNAGKATTKGFELQLTAVPIEGLQIGGTLGYLNASYDQFLSSSNPLCPPAPAAQPPGCAVSYGGRTLPYAPQWTGSILGSYTFDVAHGAATASVQYTYTGKKWGNYTYAPTEALPAVGLLNANVSWGPDDANWSLELWGRNIANKTYVATALDVPPLFTEATLGNPREWGATLKFNM